MHWGTHPNKETVDTSLISNSQVHCGCGQNQEIKFKLQRWEKTQPEGYFEAPSRTLCFAHYILGLISSFMQTLECSP